MINGPKTATVSAFRTNGPPPYFSYSFNVRIAPPPAPSTTPSWHSRLMPSIVERKQGFGGNKADEAVRNEHGGAAPPMEKCSLGALATAAVAAAESSNDASAKGFHSSSEKQPVTPPRLKSESTDDEDPHVDEKKQEHPSHVQYSHLQQQQQLHHHSIPPEAGGASIHHYHHYGYYPAAPPPPPRPYSHQPYSWSYPPPPYPHTTPPPYHHLYHHLPHEHMAPNEPRYSSPRELGSNQIVHESEKGDINVVSPSAMSPGLLPVDHTRRFSEPTFPVHNRTLTSKSDDAKTSTGTPVTRKRRASMGKWSEEEDEVLRKAVKEFGGKNWKKIASRLHGRTDVQCLHRWQKVLRPGLVKGPWTPEEDETVIRLVEVHGTKKWSHIARQLNGRLGKQCRERWYNHLDPNINK